ncbi:MAG: Na/Pi cotransporter family protein [Magnetococcales bacterium]|nr:Na/Pi cotransporter family protein [Magnetococcales bacterium]
MELLSKTWTKRLLSLGILGLCLAALSTTWAAEAAKAGKNIEFGTITMSLFGGLAIFLYGMEKMGDALKIVAGEKMKSILATLTVNRVAGLFTGLVVTAIIQSSSVTTVLLVGFVTADLMNLSQAIGVILGADIGTTVTAQIVAFKVTKYASLLIAVGFTMVFVGKQENFKQYGHLILGLGMIFFGMGVMSDSMSPLRSYEPFIEMMRTFDNPVIGILVSTLFTGVIQSSSATMGVVVALAMQGLISLDAGIALAFGANIGTCATAGLAVIGRPRPAVRVAVAHVSFKIAGVAIFAWFIPQLAELCRTISPAYPHLEGAARLAAEVPRQVANAHTLFNVIMACMFLPIGGLFARWCMWVVPEPKAGEEVAEVDTGVYRPKYLDDSYIETPALALGMVRREINVMADVLEKMIAGLPAAVFHGNMAQMEEIRKMDDQVDDIHKAVTHYLSRVGGTTMSPQSADEVLAAMTAVSEFESMGDVIENNFYHLAEACSKAKVKFSPEVIASMTEYHTSVFKSFKFAAMAFVADDHKTAESVMKMKDELAAMDAKDRLAQISSLQTGSAAGSIETFNLQMDIRENMKRIYYHAKRLAKVVARVEDAAAWKTSAAAAPTA